MLGDSRAPAGSCNSADTTAAIDQAVADGVDAINFSISGTLTAFTNSIEVSFLFAAAAGVYVSASAGNSGPTVSTVAHPSPWITTTAAGTHNRDGRGSESIDGITYNGGSSAATAVTGQLVVYGAPIPARCRPSRLQPRSADALCYPGSVPPSTGKIVVCQRGVNARIDKSLAVKQAGGIGMIMVNFTPNSVNADLHFVPSLHLNTTRSLRSRRRRRPGRPRPSRRARSSTTRTRRSRRRSRPAARFWQAAATS